MLRNNDVKVKTALSVHRNKALYAAAVGLQTQNGVAIQKLSLSPAFG
jgi:hypothetical protein